MTPTKEELEIENKRLRERVRTLEMERIDREAEKVASEKKIRIFGENFRCG